MNQCERILKYMERYGSISNREAVIELGIGRLASRIHDLTREGYIIERETVKGKNKFGEETHFTRYRIGGKA